MRYNDRSFSASVMGGILFFSGWQQRISGNRPTLYAVTAEGSTLHWRLELQAPGTPVPGFGNELYVLSEDRGLIAIHHSLGNVLWQYKPEISFNFSRTPLLGKDEVYLFLTMPDVGILADAVKIHAVDRNGKLRWVGDVFKLRRDEFFQSERLHYGILADNFAMVAFSTVRPGHTGLVRERSCVVTFDVRKRKKVLEDCSFNGAIRAIASDERVLVVGVGSYITEKLIGSSESSVVREASGEINDILMTDTNIYVASGRGLDIFDRQSGGGRVTFEAGMNFTYLSYAEGSIFASVAGPHGGRLLRVSIERE